MRSRTKIALSSIPIAIAAIAAVALWLTHSEPVQYCVMFEDTTNLPQESISESKTQKRYAPLLLKKHPALSVNTQSGSALKLQVSKNQDINKVLTKRARGGSSQGQFNVGYAAPSAYSIQMHMNSAAMNTEELQGHKSHSWNLSSTDPLSTFSIDVDRAGYSLLRRFIQEGRTPPSDAIRLEELVNYFDYQYPDPQSEHPFTVKTDLVRCPWNPKNILARVAMQSKRIPKEKLPPSNFVFLLDVSGSMSGPDRLPLVQQAMITLLKQMNAKDRVAIVVYAGQEGLALPSTPVQERSRIESAILALRSGGSTNGVGGIELAYQIAQQNFIAKGNNRIIWATDGDFNVGISSTASMVELIEKKRDSGIFLSMVGVGTGNLKDHRMEQIADKGNGNYLYFDDIQEANKAFVREYAGSMHTIAKDVKLQIEFNPARVKRWKQIGYENRALASADFKDDRKDAGELGAGHSVTAFYEIEPQPVQINELLEGAKTIDSATLEDDLRYQVRQVKEGLQKSEWMLVKARYKKPDQNRSIPLEWPVFAEVKSLQQSSPSMRLSIGIVAYALKMRSQEEVAHLEWGWIISTVGSALGQDPDGDRVEFLQLVQKSKSLLAPTSKT